MVDQPPEPKPQLKAGPICLMIFLALAAITLALFLGGIWTQDERWTQTGFVFVVPTVIALLAFICTVELD